MMEFGIKEIMIEITSPAKPCSEDNLFKLPGLKIYGEMRSQGLKARYYTG